MSGYKNNYYYYQPNSEQLNTNKFTFDIAVNEHEITGMDFILEIKGLYEKENIAKKIYSIIDNECIDFTDRIILKYVIKNQNYDTFIFHISGTVWEFHNAYVKANIKRNFSFLIKLKNNDLNIINAYLKVYYNEPPNDPVSKLFREKPLLSLFCYNC